jgi:hypothetical protein
MDEITGHAHKSETLRRYYGGAADAMLRAGVEAVKLPAGVTVKNA